MITIDYDYWLAVKMFNLYAVHVHSINQNCGLTIKFFIIHIIMYLKKKNLPLSFLCIYDYYTVAIV